jgi:hypothetical protein
VLIIKEKEVREAIQTAAWIPCAFPDVDEDPVATAIPSKSSRARRRSRVGSCEWRRSCSVMKVTPFAIKPVVVVRSKWASCCCRYGTGLEGGKNRDGDVFLGKALELGLDLKLRGITW